MYLISICVPTYNRAIELKRLLNSIPERNQIEVVIFDDGSSDDTENIIGSYKSKLNIRYYYQNNSGRAMALHNAIDVAVGEYIVLMDSDDYFEEGGVDLILEKLSAMPDRDAFLFGINILKNYRLIPNLPPNVESNFIAIRADYAKKRDLKEVVRASILKQCNLKPEVGCRRVPTYLLWSCVAEKVSCLSFDKAVAVKEYLPGGMSDKILSLKSQNPEPLVQLNLRLSESKSYKSRKYRWRSRLLWARYAFHATAVNINRWWKFLVLLPGAVLYFVDLIKLRYASKK